MWNQLLKLTLASYLWKRYHRTLIAFPLLIIYFWVINLIHQDYLTYHQINESHHFVGPSFVIKWLMILVGIGFFIAIHVKTGSAEVVEKEETLDDVKEIERDSPLETINKIDSLKQNPSNNKKDAFANIRKKNKLRSKADVVLEKKKRQ